MQVEQGTVEGNWRPVIVADGRVCAEIRTLEEEIERAAWSAGRVASEHGYDDDVVVYCSELARVAEEEDVTRFLQELGWFFQRSYLRSLNRCPLSGLVGARGLLCLDVGGCDDVGSVVAGCAMRGGGWVGCGCVVQVG